MESSVLFSVISSSTPAMVKKEIVALAAGHCLITGQSTHSPKTQNGLRMMRIQITKSNF